MLCLLYNCRAMLCKKRDLCRRAVSVCPSVLLSVAFVIVSKRAIVSSNFFSPSSSHTILDFSRQTGWQYSGGDPSDGGVE